MTYIFLFYLCLCLKLNVCTTLPISKWSDGSEIGLYNFKEQYKRRVKNRVTEIQKETDCSPWGKSEKNLQKNWSLFLISGMKTVTIEITIKLRLPCQRRLLGEWQASILFLDLCPYSLSQYFRISRKNTPVPFMDQQLGLKIETDLKNWAQISHKALRVGFF